MITFNGVNSESQWNRAFCAALTKCNAEIFACSASARQTPGWADRFIHHTLFSGWVEAKRVTNQLSTAQESIIRSLNQKRAGTAFIIWLDASAQYPLFLSWYSDFWAKSRGTEGKWPNLVVENLKTPLELLKAMSACQESERRLHRESGNVYA